MKDGLEALREHLELDQIMHLIESTALWVDRKTFEYLPVWYPEEGRKNLMYKSNWSEPQYNTNRTTGVKTHKMTGNVSANKALTQGLGLKKKNRTNWTCCHIWGVDDSSFQKTNLIISDKRFYSCIANMVMLPTPLKAFTDVMPEVKTMLRIASAHYYGWRPEHSELPPLTTLMKDCNWGAFPDSWPKDAQGPPPKGVIKFNGDIKRNADRRKKAIRSAFSQAGDYYPKDEVIEVLSYWKIKNILY